MGRLDYLYQTELPKRAKLVYLYLYDRMDKEKKAWPSIKTIADEGFEEPMNNKSITYDVTYTSQST